MPPMVTMDPPETTVTTRLLLPQPLTHLPLTIPPLLHLPLTIPPLLHLPLTTPPLPRLLMLAMQTTQTTQLQPPTQAKTHQPT